MNKHLHRIVFNAARGVMVVVQETARSLGKATRRSTGSRGGTDGTDGTDRTGPVLRFAVASTALLTPMLMGAALAGVFSGAAHAQLAGALNVPGSVRPTVLVAPNGVPAVNITTPSAAGVSRNVYSQFNVGANGVILNNSRVSASSQLGGFLVGNPNLATGSARVILNEVNGGNASQIQGALEVAGPRSEVIVANPSGIAVSGGSFINASQVTLTTGVPQLNAFGGIDSYLVRGGTISVDGKGLDLSGTEMANLYARMVSVNAGVWASQLKVVTGANQVSADGSQITPVAGTGPTPRLLFDVAPLGGMYANSIFIVGTEAGVGARNAGTIQTSTGTASLMGLGEVAVTSAGELVNIGTIQAAGDARVNAQSVTNSGSMLSAASLKVATVGDLANSFSGVGGTLEGQRVELASGAGNVDNRLGTIRQTSAAALSLTAPTVSNTGGGWIGAEPVPASTSSGTGTTGGSTGTGSAGSTSSGSSSTGTSTGTGSTAGTSAAPVAPPAPGSITAGGAILNEGGRIYAGGPVTLQTANLVNNGGTLSVASMALNQPGFSNQGGTLNVSGAFTANLDTFDNSNGILHSGSLDMRTTGDLLNVDGVLTSDSDANLAVGGKLDNTRGSISGARALSAAVTGAILNASGALTSNQAMTVHGASLDNTLGSISSAAAGIALGFAGALTSTGRIAAATDLSVQAGSLANGTGGSLRAGNDVNVAVTGAAHNDGSITAGRHATLSADSLGGTAGVLGAGVRDDGSLASVGDLKATTANGLAAGGTNLAAGNASLQGASVDLSSSNTSASNIAITATQGNVTTSRATVTTPGTLTIVANAQPGQTLVNDAGLLSATVLDVPASNIANTNAGRIVQTGTGASTLAVSGTLDNSQSTIASNGQDLALSAGSIVNTAGQIQHAGAGTLSISAGNLNGANGSIVTNGAFAGQVTGAFVQDGGSMSAKQITLDAGSLSNRGGQIVQTGTGATGITVVGALDNSSSGVIASNGTTAIAAGSLNNQAASIRAAGSSDLSVTTTGLLDNSAGGTLSVGGNATLHAGSLKNDAGSVTAVGKLDAIVAGSATNVAGTLASNGNTTIAAASLDSTSGHVASVAGDLKVSTTGTTTNTAGRLQAGGTTTLSNAGLANDRGQVTGNAVAIDTHGGALSNALGTIGSVTTLDIASGALTNDAGLLQSGGAMTVNTSGQALSNTNAAGYTNGQGGIVSADTLTLTTGALNNSAGFIGSKGALTATTGAFSNVNAGVILGQSTVAIDTQGAAYDNTGGQTLAVGDLTLHAGAGQVINQAGLLRSAGTTTVNASTIDNSNTAGTNQGIEGQNVALAANTVTNDGGAIRGTSNVTVTSGGTVSNLNGLMSAGDTLAIVDPNAANPAAKTLNVLNTQGTLVANQLVKLDAARFSADGTVTSGQDLSIALTQDLVNNATVSASGNLTYGTTGTLTNNGKLAAGSTLTVSGSDVTNSATGEMSGTDTTVVASGTLTNRGLINSNGATRIDAGTVNNLGTGRIYGDAVSIGAGSVTNSAETVNGSVSAGTIAARNSLDIGANVLTNQDDALIYSFNTLAVGGALDAGRKATGQGSTLNNLSASIESGGNMAIGMAEVNSLDTHLQVVRVRDTASRTYLATTDGRVWSYDDTWGDPATRAVYHRDANGTVNIIAYGYADWHVTTQTDTDTATNADPARIVAGGNMDINGHLLNKDSQVIAGGSLHATTFDNDVTPGTQTSTDTSRVAYGYTAATPGQAPVELHFYPAPSSTTITVGSYRYDEYTAAGTSVPIGAAATGSASAAAGTAGGVTASNRHTILEVASAVNGVNGASGSTAAGSTGASGGAASASASTPMVVRTSTPNLTVPAASLFKEVPGGTSHYLIETDPSFTNKRAWLSSDYLLANLGLDPNTTLKRLGDGFYEQQLIDQQVAQLTGYRYVAGYTNDQDEYTALMNAGVTFGKQYGLAIGVALTPAQMAQLTSDIVWLVEQTVTLPDGSTQQVLVPQVYVRVRPGDIDGSGALLSADSLNITTTGGVVNSGTVAGRTAVKIDAGSIDELNGRISGGTVALTAIGNVNIVGGTVDARNALTIHAGGNLDVVSTTRSNSSIGGVSTNQDRIAGLYVTNPNGGTLIASAGNNFTLDGATVRNAGNGATTLTAGNNLDLGTVKVGTSMLGLSQGSRTTVQTAGEVGSTVSGGGDVTLTAGHDLSAREANVNAMGDLDVKAGNDITIESGRSTTDMTYSAQWTDKNLLNRTRNSFEADTHSNTAVGSTFSGNNILLQGGGNVNLVGSDIAAVNDASITAGGSVNIVSAVEQSSANADRSRQTTGVFAPRPSDASIDRSRSSEDSASTTHQDERGSSISSGGKLAVTASDQVNVYASTLSAGSSLDVTGKAVTIVSGVNDDSASFGSSSSRQSILPTGAPVRTGHGAGAHEDLTNSRETTTLAAATLSGNTVNITATDGDITLGAAHVNAGTSASLAAANGAINFDTVTTGVEVSQNRGEHDWAYQRQRDSGVHTEVANYTQINTPSLTLSTPSVNVQVGQNATKTPLGTYVAQQTMAQALQAQAGQPGLGWLTQIQSDPKLADVKVNWQGVPLAQRQWAEAQGGLTQAGAAVVTIAAIALSWGAASEAGLAAGQGAGYSYSAAAGWSGWGGAAISGAVSAGVGSIASQAAVGLINHNGDIGAVLEELSSSQGIKRIVTAMATAGAVQGLDSAAGIGGWTAGNVGNILADGSTMGWTQVLGRNLLDGATAGVVYASINGTSVESAIQNGLLNGFLNTAAAGSATVIGANGPLGNQTLNAFTADVAHAIAGCLVGAGKAGAGYGLSAGDGCSAGAIGAVVGHLTAEFLTNGGPRDISEVLPLSQLMGGIAGALIGGNQASADIAAGAAANAVEYNECGATRMCGGSGSTSYGATHPLLDSTGRVIYGGDGKPISVPDGVDMNFFAAAGVAAKGDIASVIADLYQFGRGNSWDLQRLGPYFDTLSIDAATVAIGIYAASAGISIDLALTIQNAVALTSHYSAGTVFDSNFTNLPIRNIDNTRIGYSLVANGRFK